MPEGYYGEGFPYRPRHPIPGKLLVIEGPDYAGRSTQVGLLRRWLEARGHAVATMGLHRSKLVSEPIAAAKEGKVLGRKTLSLLHATDLADQLETRILPALEAGFVVLADRYVHTLIARDVVRGADRDWLRKLFGFALRPDAVFYLDVPPGVLVHRALRKHSRLGYWESGRDLGLSDDPFESFHRYQERLRQAFEELAREDGFRRIDGTRPVKAIQEDLRAAAAALLETGAE